MALDPLRIAYRPYWWDIDEPLRQIHNDPMPSASDVVIVGGGYTGMAAALVFARAGKSVTIIEKSTPGYGASTRNGGINSASIRPSHGELEQQWGRDFADELYKEASTARIDLADFCETEGIDAMFKLTGWFKGAMSGKHYDYLSREADLLQSRLGIPCRMVSQADQHNEIVSDRFYGGMVEDDIGGFHASKFFAGFLRIITEAGVKVFEKTAVEDIQDHPTAGKMVITDKGSIHADIVVVATNGYTGGAEHKFSRFLRQRTIPIRSSIIVTEDLGVERVKALMPTMRMYGNTAKLTTYFRPTPDGRRILLGARGAEKEPSIKTVNFLRNRLISILPQLADVHIDYCWTGNVAFNRQLIPRIFTHDGIHYSAAYAGSGTVWARWCGKKLAEQVLGQTNAPSVLTGSAPASLPFYNGQPWFLPMVYTWYGLQDHINEWRHG
jgi:glycine/D-amino acid oxidase-like deaminating enzyme